MTKREGILSGLMAMIGLMSGRATFAQEPQTWNGGKTSTTITSITIKPAVVTFALGQFSSYNFTLGDETITLSPSEVWAALKAK